MSEHALRKPCRCGGTTGQITTKNNQDVVRCADCGAYQYNAPKTETGRAVRTVSTLHEAIKPKLRWKIVQRANGHCELCGKSGELHVGHIISVDTAMRNGLTDQEINSEENLCAACPECNLGMGKEPLPLRFYIAVLKARLLATTPTNELDDWNNR